MVTVEKTVLGVAREVIGMSVREGESIISDAGFSSRVVIIHGAGIPGCGEHNAQRVKLFVENDKIYDTRVG